MYALKLLTHTDLSTLIRSCIGDGSSILCSGFRFVSSGAPNQHDVGSMSQQGRKPKVANACLGMPKNIAFIIIITTKNNQVHYLLLLSLLLLLLISQKYGYLLLAENIYTSLLDVEKKCVTSLMSLLSRLSVNLRRSPTSQALPLALTCIIIKRQ